MSERAQTDSPPLHQNQKKPADYFVVPVLACSRRHFMRSSPINVSQRPLLGAVAPGPLTTPLVPTLVSGLRGAVLPAPALSALVPVEGIPASRIGGRWLFGAALTPVVPVLEPMLEPDWVCASDADDSARSPAAVTLHSRFSFMWLLWKRMDWHHGANGVPQSRASGRE